MDEKVMYVLLDLNSGEFSNSWTQEEFDLYEHLIIPIQIKDGCKIIKYTCLNDSEFEFMDKMKLR